MNPYAYGAEKFAKALHSLVGARTIQERLCQAATHDMNFVRPELIPDRELSRKVKDLMRQLSLVAGMGDEGTIRTTTSAMSDAEAEAIVHEIVDLALEFARKSQSAGNT